MAVTGKVKQTSIVKSEVNYRKLQALNYSMIKTWDENPMLFFDQYKMGKARKSKPTASTITGDIAHFYVLDCHGDDLEFENKFDEKFARFEGEKGSGQVFVLCDHLFDVTEENRDEEGKIVLDLQTRFEQAVDRVKADGKYKGKDVDKIWDDFEKNGQEYFKSLMDNIGKTIVTDVQIDKGKFVGKSVLNDEYTANYFKGNIYTSFPIEWKYNNVDCSETLCKSELDLIKIDDKKKRIYLVDLKCTWDNEGFEYSYLKNYYYIQQAYYYLAAMHYFANGEHADYTIVPMQYIAADTSLNNRRPLIYPCSAQDLQAGLDGFKLGHKYYKGVHELMDEICWAENNNIWNISKEAHGNKGVMKLNFNYE